MIQVRFMEYAGRIYNLNLTDFNLNSELRFENEDISPEKIQSVI